MAGSKWDADNPFGRSTSSSSPDVDFTSLIDVVFLLLIFFMVLAAINQAGEVDIPEARHGIGVDPEESTIVTVYLEDVASGEPRYVLGDGDGDKGDLDATRAYIQSGIREGKMNVIIKAEREVPHKFVLDLAKVVSSFDGAKVDIAVEEAK